MALGQSLTPSCLSPNEHLTGTPAEQAELAERLAAQRAVAALDKSHPLMTFSLLHWVIQGWKGSAAGEVFELGAILLAARYRELGLHQLLPVDRVWVGIRSGAPDAFGGFHHPDQGYRHVQLASVITRYGRLDDPQAASPELVALDLFRSYAHDCLHFGSFRAYRLQRGTVVRSRYGINRCDENGRTYSAPDGGSFGPTRNLGIVMEGATDQEARTLARTVADRLGLAGRVTAADGLAFRDTTGRLAAADLDRAEADPASRFHGAMADYERRVGMRYHWFLRETGGAEADGLHDLIVTAMIDGDVRRLTGWLDDRHGPRAFRRLFRSLVYAGPDPGE